MPSYCSAINCKSSGLNKTELSFFKFPFSRKDILQRWIKAIRRNKWMPTIHSRLCSSHFEDSCFCVIKVSGGRLRLQSDAVPTIFDFRTITGNRKKPDKNVLIAMNETECPDKQLFVVDDSVQVCLICNKTSSNAVSSLDDVIDNYAETVTIRNMIIELTTVADFDSSCSKICNKCLQRLKNSYLFKNELDTALGQSPTIRTSRITMDAPDEAASLDSRFFCEPCNEHLTKSDIPYHLVECKMRFLANNLQIPVEGRRLLICSLCNYLIYNHDMELHLERCKEL